MPACSTSSTLGRIIVAIVAPIGHVYVRSDALAAVLLAVAAVAGLVVVGIVM